MSRPSTAATVRAATADDIQQVLALWQSGAEEPTDTDDTAGIAALLERDDQALLLAVVEDRVVGSVVAGWDGWRGNLYRLAVLPGFRRQGVATTLVEAAESRLAALGARRVHAGVLGAYPSATGFWLACGYGFDQRILRHRKNLYR